MRLTTRPLALALGLLLGLSGGGLRAEPKGFPRPLPVIEADIPERCPNALNEVGYTLSEYMSGPDAAIADRDLRALASIFKLQNQNAIRHYTAFVKETDYYARRSEVKAKATAALAEMSGEEWLKAASNYTTLLVSMGEFQQVVDEFGPKAKLRKEYAKDGRIEFNVAQSYFRLGKYKDALPFVRSARAQLPKDELDTLWQLMLVELGVYGRDLYTRHSAEYTVEHIKRIFPNEDISKLPFEDATDRMGIVRWGGTGGAAFADFDGDGWDELLFTPKFHYPQLYQNDQGRLRLMPRENLGNNACTALTATVADYDNDGKLDIFRTCCNFDGAGTPVLHKNLGDLRFSDATSEAKLDYKGVSGMHNAWGDYDLDGHLDLAVSDMFGPTRLYRNRGDNTYEETTKKAGIDTPGGNSDDFGAVASSFGDYDADGWPDLYTQGWGWKKLYRNNGDGTFKDVTEKAGLDSGAGKKGFNSFFFDYDNDGRLDLFAGQYVTNSDVRWGYGIMCLCSNLLKPDGYSEREWQAAGTIYRNNGDGTFTNMNAQTRFIPLGVMGVAPIDWNNDGYEDLVMGTGGPYSQQVEPTMFYQNNGDGTFANLTPFTEFGLWGKGHGLSAADYDHDGNVDFFVNMGGVSMGDSWPSLLLHNTGNKNHWLEVALKAGPGTNSHAVGAQVTVSAGKTKKVMELTSGGKFSGSSTLRLHFGLAGHEKIDTLEVSWPNAAHDKTVLRDIAADQAIEISAADGTYRRLWEAPRPSSPAGSAPGATGDAAGRSDTGSRSARPAAVQK